MWVGSHNTPSSDFGELALVFKGRALVRVGTDVVGWNNKTVASFRRRKQICQMCLDHVISHV
jgi:hypothetical protein